MKVRSRKLTLVGRSYLILSCLALVNLIVWIVALCLFAPVPAKRRILAFCSIAWTLGLRHALDADHISAIDNATRQLVARGRRPMTCGLFFSLGHSTIVIVVTLAIAISTGIANKLDGVSSIGGIVGISVSAAFLFLLALINSFVLHRVLEERRRVQRGDYELNEPRPAFGFIARAVRPLLRLIDRPYKLYPIGILFGFGFDTASEISLLGISALATGPSGGGIATSEIIILPALFTAGMSLVDSIDSVIMLWGYAMPARGTESWKRIWSIDTAVSAPADGLAVREAGLQGADTASAGECLDDSNADDPKDVEAEKEDYEIQKSAIPSPAEISGQHLMRGRISVYMDLSVILTLISIIVAFAISIIEFMGIALEKCTACGDAAESDVGTAGRWWRFWQTMNANSGYVGAGIVGVMVLCGATFILSRRWSARRKKHSKAAEPSAEP